MEPPETPGRFSIPASSGLRKLRGGPAGQPAADLGPGVEAQLIEDVGDVGLDSALGQEQPGCYLPVAEAASDNLAISGSLWVRTERGSVLTAGAGLVGSRAAGQQVWSGLWPSRGHDGAAVHVEDDACDPA